MTEDHKRWIVFGIALNHVLVPSIRRKLNQEVSVEYNNLKLSNHIDVQVTHSFPAPKYPTGNALNYENINANNTKLKPPHYKKNDYDYSTFDYRVTSYVDFAKLFLQIYMAKFTAFDETCDASAVLNLLERIPIFTPTLQNAANVVREGRNMWGHCNFTEWNEASFTKRFGDLKNLVKELKLSPADEKKAEEVLNDWEKMGMDLKYAFFVCLFVVVGPTKGMDWKQLKLMRHPSSVDIRFNLRSTKLRLKIQCISGLYADIF